MEPAKLFRQRNCLAKQLECSLCVFRTALGDDAPAPIPPELEAACARLGARLEFVTKGVERTASLVVSHAAADAFGGMYLFARWLPLPEPRSGGPWYRRGRAGEFEYHHFAVDVGRAAPDTGRATPTPRTMTQRCVGAIMGALALPGSARTAVVVAKDDPSVIDASSYPGNSLVILEFARDALVSLCEAPRGSWRDTLLRESDRVRAVALRRPELLRRSEVAVTFSSVGDVATMPWALRLDPSFFEMIPTPASDSSATVVLWGRGKRQALTVCAKPGHVVLSRLDFVRSAWEAALA